MLILSQPVYEIYEVENLTTDTIQGKQSFGSTGIQDIVAPTGQISTLVPTPIITAIPVNTMPLPIDSPSDIPIPIT
jgi:hypothetical protein